MNISRTIRNLHSWTGIFVFPLVFIVGVTGFYLNHEKLFKPTPVRTMVQAARKDARPLDKQAARQISERVWPGQAINGISSTKRNKRPWYQIRNQQRDTLLIDRTSGAYILRYEYSEEHYSADGQLIAERLRWNRLMKRLHTGDLGGTIGRLLADAVSLSLVLFSLSGAWLWLQAQRRKKAALG